MIESGDYIVPRVGSDPYLRKPPLINWLVAVSFKIFGQRNEWTARVPSVICVLIVALVFVSVGRAGLGSLGSTIAAIIWLTNFGIIEKGRLIEIEALYVSLFAIAFVCWLSWWEAKRSPWLIWIVPWFFLGLGWLAKGPLHLFFFYAIVIAVLWNARELRTIWNLPHV
ncbi:MAG TPA: glycosyltransferase family 39 protein, partial [Chthoniobacterales bacterium]|nr:glycosyltransferase family 39 protein [Chthoniobacterales bacterium]